MSTGVAWMDGRARQARAKLRLGRRRGRGLRGAQEQARLGRRKGWEDGQADGPNRAKIALGSLLLLLLLSKVRENYGFWKIA